MSTHQNLQVNKFKLTSHYTDLILNSNRLLNQNIHESLVNEASTFLSEITIKNKNIKTLATNMAEFHILTISGKNDYREQDKELASSILLRSIIIKSPTLNIAEIIKIFKKNLDIDVESGIMLLMAIRFCKCDVATLLIENNASVCFRGHYSIILAFIVNDFNTIRLLISKGSDPNYYYWHVLGNDAANLLKEFDLYDITNNYIFIERALKNNVIDKKRQLSLLDILHLGSIDNTALYKSIPYVHEMLYNLYEKILSVKPRFTYYKDSMVDHTLQYWKITKVPEPFLSEYDREVD
jgi:hypothetical protein